MKATNPVPPGYKRTKVGVIPEEWEVVKLGEVFDFIKTYSNSRSHLSRNGEIEYIHYGDIHTKFKFHLDLQKERLPRISKDKIKGEPSYVKEGDLIIADASEDYADIGKSIEVINIGDKKIISGLHTFLLRDKSNYFANGYKGFLLYNKAVSKSMKKIATGVSVLGISKTNLSNIKIPLPPLKEQQKIAQILSTWDEAIAKLEALIEEKERFKKGLMQKLLSAELRFPGFEGEWEEVRLGEVGTFRSGFGFPENQQGKTNQKYPFYKVSDMNLAGNEVYMKRENHSISEEVLKQLKGKTIPKNSIIFAKVGAALLLDRRRITIRESCLDNNMMAFIPNSELVDLRFIYSKFLMIRFSKLANVGALPSIGARDLKTYKISIPKLKEQQKIAKFLTMIDKEIALIKDELETLKEQKRGLMQKLLSGEVRVKYNEGGSVE